MNTQQIIINELGQVVQGTNTFFDISPFQYSSVFSHFPMVENITNHLIREKHFERVTIPKVETSFPSGKSGIFDFHFSLISLENSVRVSWIIEDFTSRYQQERMERQIKQDDLLKKNK